MGTPIVYLLVAILLTFILPRTTLKQLQQAIAGVLLLQELMLPFIKKSPQCVVHSNQKVMQTVN